MGTDRSAEVPPKPLKTRKIYDGVAKHPKKLYNQSWHIPGEEYEELIPSRIKPNEALVAELCRRKGRIDARNGN